MMLRGWWRSTDALLVKLPRIPFVIVRPNRPDVAFARSPPLLAIAWSMTSIACAPYAAYGFGTVPTCLPKLFTNVAPAPVRALGGAPATLMYAPLATAPFAPGSLKPSGIWSLMLGLTDLMSCISFAPLLHAMPPRNTAVAPE